ncbi:hypothetical protein HVV74_22660 (plasmid) [Escherichia coli]|nr:hypothetical protein HVV74_22660 [Escherichia coli]
MEKTLIALMIATVSGSAMAEVGTVTFSGTLEVRKNTPWEVIIGKDRPDLNAEIEIGKKIVLLRYNGAIPILGIRPKTTSLFDAAQSISPQINFGGMLDLEENHKGMAKLSVPVKSQADGKKFATLVAPLTMGSMAVFYNSRNGAPKKVVLIASEVGDAFFGALPMRDTNSLDKETVYNRITNLSAEFTRNFDPSLLSYKWYDDGFLTSRFDNEEWKYQAFYGSGIESNQEVRLVLDEPVKTSGHVSWVATLPITVSYM